MPRFKLCKTIFIVCISIFIQNVKAQVDEDGNSFSVGFQKSYKTTEYDSTFSLSGFLDIPDGFEAGPGQLSKDGLEYYLSLKAEGGSDLYVAARTTLEDSFSMPALLSGSVNSDDLREIHPSITEDKLTLVYTRNPDNLWTSNQLYISTRNSTSAPFDSGRAINEINLPNIADTFPYISPDGLHLYFTRGTIAIYTLMVSSRISIADTFLTPVALKVHAPDKARSAWLTSDELELYYTVSDTASILLYHSRSSVNDSFSTSLQFPGINNHGKVSGPSLIEDQLFLHSSSNEGLDSIRIFSIKPVVTNVTGKRTQNSLLNTYFLAQNYPNPFNPSTKITYTIPNEGFVTLDIYDIRGRRVVRLINQKQLANTYNINFFAENLHSGIYFYTLKVNNLIIDTKKMVYLK